MKTYNRALDYTVLALAQLQSGNGPMAARLLAKAVASNDINAAIATLEASNKHAFELQAKAKAAAVKAEAVKADATKTVASKSRLKASEDKVEVEDDADEDMDFDGEDDPLADLPDEDDTAVEESEEVEDAPAVAMAKVLSSMSRRATKK